MGTLELKRLSGSEYYDRENKHHPLNYELQSETNTTGRSEAVYENERTKIKCNEEKYR